MDSRLHQALASDVADALPRQVRSLLPDKLPTTEPHVPNNPLRVALQNGDVKLAKQILGLNPELARELDQHGSTALHLAAAAGDHEVVKLLLKQASSNLGLMQDRCGMMPIHIAALNGRINALRELFDACPDSRRKLTCLSDTVLHLAVTSNCFEAVQFLLEKLDGDVELLNAKNAKGNTMLHLAVGMKQAETVKLLLSTPRIDVNAMNLRNFTPLDVLLESPSQKGDMAIASVLLAAGGKRTAEDVRLPGQASATDSNIPAAKAQSSITSVSNCSKQNCNPLMHFAGIIWENDAFIFFLLVSSSLCTALVLSTSAMLQLFPNSVHRMLFNYHTTWLWFSKMIVAWVTLQLTAHLFGRLSKKLISPAGGCSRRDQNLSIRRPGSPHRNSTTT